MNRPAPVPADIGPSRDAAAYGFHPQATGVDNAAALQRAVDAGGTIHVARPGVYRLAETVLLGGDTALRFGAGAVVQKVEEQGPFMHVLLNRGALTGQTDHRITVEGLRLAVNGVDNRQWRVYGLRGQIAFMNVSDLRIRGFRCLDLAANQFAIHICTFEDLLIDDVIVHGRKDGVHLGRGRRFVIRNGVFNTFDDAIALNAQDYDTSNPQLGWIEDGLIENCHDLHAEEATGFFARLLGGGWSDWSPGLELQNGDAVVHAGRVYRVRAEPDGQTYTTHEPPVHAEGVVRYGDIDWQCVQHDALYTAGVRNVTFRDIWLSKPRSAFSLHLDHDRYNRSWRPGSPMPRLSDLRFEGVRVLHDDPCPFMCVTAPTDLVRLTGCTLGSGGVATRPYPGLEDDRRPMMRLTDCVRRDETGLYREIETGAAFD